MIVIVTVKLLFAYIFILSVEFEHFNGFYCSLIGSKIEYIEYIYNMQFLKR